MALQTQSEHAAAYVNRDGSRAENRRPDISSPEPLLQKRHSAGTTIHRLVDFQDGSTLHPDHFTTGRKIGFGGYADVLEGTFNEARVAVKIPKKRAIVSGVDAWLFMRLSMHRTLHRRLR